jgi:tRNA-intron endonuclease
MEKIQAYITGQVIFSNTSEAHEINKKSSFGELKEDRIQYSLPEVLFLVEKGKMDVISKNKIISKSELFNRFKRIDNKIQTKYPVFKDLREKGYIVKTALKFGADFRIYGKGEKPGKEHARWICFTSYESQKFSWHDFSAKNRIAHSTKKNLLLAIVDEEGDITYYEVKWIKP